MPHSNALEQGGPDRLLGLHVINCLLREEIAKLEELVTSAGEDPDEDARELMANAFNRRLGQLWDAQRLVDEVLLPEARKLEGITVQAQEAQLTPGYSGRARYVPYDGGWSLFHLEFDPPMVIPARMAARYGTPPPPMDQDPTTPGPWFPLTVEFTPAEFTPAESSDVS